MVRNPLDGPGRVRAANLARVRHGVDRQFRRHCRECRSVLAAPFTARRPSSAGPDPLIFSQGRIGHDHFARPASQGSASVLGSGRDTPVSPKVSLRPRNDPPNCTSLPSLSLKDTTLKPAIRTKEDHP